MSVSNDILRETRKALVGKDQILRKVYTAILAGGHVLLEDVPGVGPKRREALRKHFGSMRAIREADVETLSAVVPRAAAEAVYRHFHQEQGEPD